MSRRDPNDWSVPEPHSIASDGKSRGFANRSDSQRQRTVAIDMKLASRIVTGFDEFATERQHGRASADLVAHRFALIRSDDDGVD